ncbi:hypothetical protein QYM36_007613, partial [Artemia franciscana]
MFASRELMFFYVLLLWKVQMIKGSNETENGQYSCQPNFGSKVLLCYYSGYEPLVSTEPCLCSHLVIEGATLLDSGKVHVNSDDLLSLKLMKERNPNLLIILSIGAPALTKSNFTSLTTLPGIQKVFIESIVDHVQSDRINGIEINWAWSFRSENLMEHRQNLNQFTKVRFRAIYGTSLLDSTYSRICI